MKNIALRLSPINDFCEVIKRPHCPDEDLQVHLFPVAFQSSTLGFIFCGASCSAYLTFSLSSFNPLYEALVFAASEWNSGSSSSNCFNPLYEPLFFAVGAPGNVPQDLATGFNPLYEVLVFAASTGGYVFQFYLANFNPLYEALVFAAASGLRSSG